MTNIDTSRPVDMLSSYLFIFICRSFRFFSFLFLFFTFYFIVSYLPFCSSGMWPPSITSLLCFAPIMHHNFACSQHWPCAFLLCLSCQSSLQADSTSVFHFCAHGRLSQAPDVNQSAACVYVLAFMQKMQRSTEQITMTYQKQA